VRHFWVGFAGVWRVLEVSQDHGSVSAVLVNLKHWDHDWKHQSVHPVVAKDVPQALQSALIPVLRTENIAQAADDTAFVVPKNRGCCKLIHVESLFRSAARCECKPHKCSC